MNLYVVMQNQHKWWVYTKDNQSLTQSIVIKQIKIKIKIGPSLIIHYCFSILVFSLQLLRWLWVHVWRKQTATGQEHPQRKWHNTGPGGHTGRGVLRELCGGVDKTLLSKKKITACKKLYLYVFLFLNMSFVKLFRLYVTSLWPKKLLVKGSVTAGRKWGQRSSDLDAFRWLRRWCVTSVPM